MALIPQDHQSINTELFSKERQTCRVFSQALAIQTSPRNNPTRFLQHLQDIKVNLENK